jgi:hypothetical protein
MLCHLMVSAEELSPTNLISKNSCILSLVNLVILSFVRFGALEEVFMSYRPHGAWRTMEVFKELA